MSAPPYSTNDRKVIPFLLAGLVVLFGGLYVACYFFTTDRIPRGSTVAGVDVGGMTPAGARLHLVNALAVRSSTPILVTANGRRWQVNPARAGLSIDVAASVAQAGAGRSWSPARMWDYLTGGAEQPAVVLVQRTRLQQAVARMAAKIDKPAVPGSVSFVHGTARAHYPRPGWAIDQNAAASALTRAFLAAETSIRVHGRPVTPEISKREVSRAMNTFANPAVSAPVVLVLGRRHVRLSPRDFDPALALVREDGRLVPHVDRARLLARVGPALSRARTGPRDAAVAIVNGRPAVTPGRDAVTYRPARVVHAFLRGLTRHDARRTVAVRGTRKPPAVTTADVTRLGITEQVSQFTSYFPDAPGRTAELSAATAVLDGTLLKPGDTLNLADALGLGGAPDIGAGYIADNGVFTQDYGSSTSQVATSVFTAAFMAGLADVEPTPHSIHVVSQPVEGQTSVDWSSAGLAFKDNTRYGVLVQAWVDPSTPAHRGAVQVRFWSTKQWDVRTSASPRYAVTDPATTHGSGPGCVPNHGAQGYTVDLHRDLTGLRGRVRRETVHTIYAPSDRVVCS